MDDKTLNLWRQIESCRRRAQKRPGRTTPDAPPALPDVTN